MNEHRSDKSGYEKQNVNIKHGFILALLLLVVLTVILVAVNEYFLAGGEDFKNQSRLQPGSLEIRELRAKETEALTTYKTLDREKGIYQIPIDYAMKLLAEEAIQKSLMKNK